MCVCVVFVVHRTGVKHEIMPNMTFQEVLVKILRLSGYSANNALIKKKINSPFLLNVQRWPDDMQAAEVLVSTVTVEMATTVNQSNQTNKPVKL